MTETHGSDLARVTPVILAGGTGTRLWPLSRAAYPKQFAPILNDATLFRQAARRLTGGTAGLSFANPVLLTNSTFRFIVVEQLAQEGIGPAAILIEPEVRNTAPAILAAALHIGANDPEAVMLVAPSDHVVPDTAAFHEAVGKGFSAVAKGDLVTFGIQPTHAETGYGYLELRDKPDSAGAPVKLSRFVEKPDRGRAEQMLAAGNYLWNAGIFLFAAKDLIAAFETHAPDMLRSVRDAVDQAQVDLGFLRLAAEPWAKAETVSIDYAIMERADNLSVVPFHGGWSDLGGWDAVWNHSQRDENGVVLSGQATAIGCNDSLLRSDSEDVELVGIGLSNIIAVAMDDAVLVADKSRSQDVRLAVDTLKAKGAKQAETFPKDHRPWGWFECLSAGSRFQVKRITVLPGECLSLQSHQHRAEHWVVVEGTAKVTLDGEMLMLSENESTYIPIGAVHRMENPGPDPLVFIEVQTGSYVGEDDIIRYEDKYARQ